MATPAPVLDPADLGWAAGFFDAEGSALLHADESRPGYLRLEVTVPQADRERVPMVLVRFQDAVGGLGRIVGPDARDLYRWIARGRLEALATVALLWDHLGEVKCGQANDAIKRFLNQYESNPPLARGGRHAALVFSLVERSRREPVDTRQLDLAWAAGFLDGEGCFGLVRSKARVRGPRWYKVRASATQHGRANVVPQVLLRLQRALGGMGRIERHSGVEAFKWVAEGDAHVESVIRTLAPFLGERKVAQAGVALDAFRAQLRLKGDATRCLRGHVYNRAAMKGGRLRHICNACARLADRAERAARGSARVPSRTPRGDTLSAFSGCGLARFKALDWGSRDSRVQIPPPRLSISSRVSRVPVRRTLG